MGSNAKQYVHVEKGPTGVAVLTICREPVNSMNLDVWAQLGAALDALERDASVRGVIIASGVKKDIFTAGNDLTELYTKTTSKERYTRFWHAQTDCLVRPNALAVTPDLLLSQTRLLASPLVTVAAIRGYCPAGGCVLALCCDARVCTPDTRVGLNEVELGIPVPLYWARLMASLVGAGRADKLLQTAAMVPAQEAVSLGLVDAAVPTAELLAAAQAELARRLAFPDSGRVATKRALRAPMAEAWHAYTEEEAQGGWVGLSQPRVVQALAGVMARLSKAQPAPKL